MPSARTIAAEASFNNEIGVPLTLCRLETDTEVCILELAMRGFGQIAALVRDRASRRSGSITNIGLCTWSWSSRSRAFARRRGVIAAAYAGRHGRSSLQTSPSSATTSTSIRVADPHGADADGRTEVGGGQLQLHRAASGAETPHALAALDALGLPRAGTRRRRFLALARRRGRAARRRAS
jgi:UDP-N-acetylmuramoyl-tripeptide--D-alanyl-D-alanine ligase